MPDNANIVLSGFMATGKTSVGRRLAVMMGRSFIDMDTVLVAAPGRADCRRLCPQGEAHFREAESALCRELSAPAGAVIAAGGGAIVRPGQSPGSGQRRPAHLPHLLAAECLRRIGDPPSRPMLRGGDPAERIALLMAERSAAYDMIPRQIDTTALSVDEVAASDRRPLRARWQ